PDAEERQEDHPQNVVPQRDQGRVAGGELLVISKTDEVVRLIAEALGDRPDRRVDQEHEQEGECGQQPQPWPGPRLESLWESPQDDLREVDVADEYSRHADKHDDGRAN